MKILISDFEISKYGGIVEHVVAKVRALKQLGHEVDIAQLSVSETSQKQFDKKISEFKSGVFQDKIKLNSQAGGYEFDEDCGYWKNNYYGFFLPPSNKIGVFSSNAFERWNDLIKDVDVIIWNFMPTNTSAWGDRDFSFWWKFFDIPTNKTKQIFVVHDAYFDQRASNISALKDKIALLECAHVAAYKCCEHIGIPRTLLLNPRFIPDDQKMPIISMKRRKTDFFAAHIFKSMKHVDDLIRAVPYFNKEWISEEPDSQYFPFSVKIAGSGIEQAYMVAKEKIKPCYVCNKKNDPDLAKSEIGLPIWERAEDHGMEYLGQISSFEVVKNLQSSKFAIDPSWCSHYAQYCRTHINGFIIEAMMNGCYPVLRDYKGANKNSCEEDILFENINAIVIPWDSTPKEFAEALRKACNMSSSKYLKDTLENFNIVKSVFNAKENMNEVLNILSKGDRYIQKNLSIGKDSEQVKRVTIDIMENLYKIKLPIKWTTN